jgi:hypothetical protein
MVSPPARKTIVVQTIPAQLIQMERHSMKQMFILVLAAVTAFAYDEDRRIAACARAR